MSNPANKIPAAASKIATGCTTATTNTLPNRSVFVGGKPDHHYFYPVQVVDYNANYVYKMICVGVDGCGNKVILVVNDILPRFEVRCPDDADLELFQAYVESFAETNPKEYKYFDIKRTQHYPGKLYSHKLRDYVALYFKSSSKRRKYMQAIQETPYEYVNRKGEAKSAMLETTFDNPSDYFTLVAAERGLQLCEWMDISSAWNTEYLARDGTILEYSIGIDSLRNVFDRATIKPPVITMAWDIETFSPFTTGHAPEVEVSYDHEPSVVFIISCIFYLEGRAEPLISVALTTMACPASSEGIVRYCHDQKDLLMKFAMLIGKMQPDHVIAFNDHEYDWPFVINRMISEGILDECIDLASIFRIDRKNEISTAIFNRAFKVEKKEIKIENDMTVKAIFLNLPGYVALDTRTILRKMFPKAEKTSLNFFLGKYKLPLKNDMDFQIMFKVFRISNIILESRGIFKWREVMAELARIRATHGDAYQPFADGAILYVKEVGNFNYRIGDLDMTQIDELMAQAKAIIDYCIIDSKRTYELLVKTNTVIDYRLVCNGAFVPISYGLYRAGGVKVRNRVTHYALKPEWNLAMTSVGKKHVAQGKDRMKYPGAYVLDPQKGMYRDHKFVKRSRRMSYCMKYPKDHQLLVDYDLSDAEHQAAVARVSISAEEFDKLYPPDTIIDKDVNDENDRPVAGFDFSSLYPSIIMNDNASPEKVITDPRYKAWLVKKYPNIKLNEVEFRYGPKTAPEDTKQLIKGWIVQHRRLPDGKFEGMGIYAYMLKELFDDRAAVKKQMDKFAAPVEYFQSWNNKLAARGSSLKEMSALDIATQRAELRKSLVEDLAIAQEQLDKHPEDERYYGAKLAGHKRIMAFFDEFFGDEANDSLSLIDIRDECESRRQYYNAVQNGKKVYMNTFYGEAGNQLSGLFVVHVAGSITTRGQGYLKRVKAHLETLGVRAIYGDTDSLYIMAPEARFVDIDSQYFSGKINKEQYWTEMVKITMKELDELQGTVKTLLTREDGASFLKMAYEEVLWPVCLIGKKKYYGIEHKDLVKFYLCTNKCSYAEFEKSVGHGVFVKGIDIVKRGISELARVNIVSMMQRIIQIDSYTRVRDEVVAAFMEIPAKQWDLKIFARSACYKLPKAGKPGNVSVLRFVDRMRAVYADKPEIGVLPPEVGERFTYVVARRSKICNAGTNSGDGMGDKYEYLSSLTNDSYATYIGMQLVPDFEYYIEHEILNHFSRFISYAGKFNTEEAVTQAITRKRRKSEENDVKPVKSGKLADEISMKLASKMLMGLYKDKYAEQGVDRMEIQRNFKAASKELIEEVDVKVGKDVRILDLTTRLLKSLENNMQKCVTDLAKKLRQTVSKSSAAKGIATIDLKGREPASLFRLGAEIRKNKIRYECDIRDLVKDMDELSISYVPIWRKYYDAIISRMKDMHVDFAPNGAESKVIHAMQESFDKLVELHRQMNCCIEDIEKINDANGLNRKKDQKIYAAHSKDIMSQLLASNTNPFK